LAIHYVGLEEQEDLELISSCIIKLFIQ